MKLLLGFIFGIFISLPSFAAKSTLEISLNTQSAQDLATQYYSYNFGSVRVNWSQYADFYLRNNGTSPVQMRGVYITGISFWAWSNCPRVLLPGQRCLARVEFRPWSEGSYFGRLRFAYLGGNIYINLYGWGVRF